MNDVGRFISKPFSLPEYSRAQFVFFRMAVESLMRFKSPIYAQIPKAGPMESVYITQNTMHSGEIVETTPLVMKTKVVFELDDIRSRNLDAVAKTVDATAEEQIALIMKHFFEAQGRLYMAAGTATDAAGAPLSFESLFVAFSKVELRFEEDGTPKFPQLVTGPALFEAMKNLPPVTEAQTKRWEAMIDDKRREFFAKRRYRKLR